MSDNKPISTDKPLSKFAKISLIIFGVLALVVFGIVLWLACSHQITDGYTVQVRISFILTSISGAFALVGSLLWAIDNKYRNWTIGLLQWAVIIFLVGILAQLMSYK